jgi:cyanophycin synthetase
MAGAAVPVELLELRVLDGPNRFFTRPAVKLEFIGRQPGEAARVADDAGDLVQRMHGDLMLPVPALERRDSVDGLRAIVAFPWRRRTRGQAIGGAAARVALGERDYGHELAALRAVAPGPRPIMPSPRVPIIAITGTNGKSTVTRLVAHVAMRAGLRVGMTNSDGVWLDGRLVEPGDWTGYGGAGRVLAERDVDVAVLETARGGILLRGIGYRRNDVSVVTNVSADHLGLQGIDTLEELAEVKSAIVRITKSDGWAVLNAEDPRVWAMRRLTRARLYAFSLDPDSPGVVDALARGGRAAVLVGDWLVIRERGARARRLARASGLPVTAAGLSRYNIANALAAAAATDVLGIDRRRIGAGLRSFRQDSAANPGRLNTYELDGRLVIVDFAHNEAGLVGLLDVCRRLAADGRVWLGLGTAGDRSDEILHRLGVVAGEGADEILIAEKPHYLRGRDREEMNDLLRRGAREGGKDPAHIEALPSERSALEAMVERSAPGDVVTIMAHAERPELFGWLEERRARPVDAARLRQLAAERARR